MTTRPDLPAFESLRHTRGKRIAHLLEIVRADGQVLRLTDHDRPIRVADRVWSPMNIAAVSVDRREAAMRSGTQDARGLLDGVVFTVADMEAYRYRGAEVFIRVIDWARPWLVFAKHRKWIRSVSRDGSAWVASMESRAQELQRASGGRFGGTFSVTCPYELGGTFCKKDISADVKTPVTVSTVVDNRRVVEFNPAGWSGTYVDDYYRDGSLVWLTGNNAGHVSAIVGYTHSTRECTLLFPTPRPIQAGDTATAKPGCDGLFTTCKTKFSNQLNFGGDPYAPSASQIIEPVEDV